MIICRSSVYMYMRVCMLICVYTYVYVRRVSDPVPLVIDGTITALAYL